MILMDEVLVLMMMMIFKLVRSQCYITGSEQKLIEKSDIFSGQ